VPEARSTLILLYPGCILFEVLLAAELLSQRGVRVDTVYPNGEAFKDSSGLIIQPTHRYASVPPDYACILIPGGDPSSIMEDTACDHILQQHAQRGALLAGVCAGVLVLAKSGVLQGKRIVHNYRSPFAPPENVRFVANFWEGASVLQDSKCVAVRDGNIVTALPHGFIAFALETLKALDLTTEEHAERLSRHYQGHFVPALAPY
jgi:protein deglycase